MSSRNNSADNGPLVSRNAARSAFRDALRLYVGRGRHYSVKQLSNATGVKDRVIECAMCDVESGDYREPELAAALSIASFLGAHFTSEWLVLAAQAAFDLPDDGDLPPGEVAADNAADNAVIAGAARDGIFDCDEKPDLRVVGRRMIKRGSQLAALAA